MTPLSRRLALVSALSVLALATSCSKTPQGAGKEDMSIGEANAKVTIIEYASVTCAHCAEFQKDVMPQLMSKYVNTGKVRYVYREFLTPPHDVSAAGILMARCAGKDKYFKVIDAIMRAQPEMFAGGSTANARPVLQRIASDVGGMTTEQFEKCVTDSDALVRLQTNVEAYNKEHNITGTPTFFINGKELRRQTGDIRDFDAAIEPLLAAK